MLTLATVDHIAIICSDYERSRAFYTDILRLELLQEHYRPDRQSWKADLAVQGRYQIELFSFPDPPPRPSRPEARGLRHLAFQVPDLDVAVQSLERTGIRVEPVRPDETRNNRRFTFIQDPDGLPIELCEACAVSS